MASQEAALAQAAAALAPLDKQPAQQRDRLAAPTVAVSIAVARTYAKGLEDSAGARFSLDCRRTVEVGR